MSRQAPTATEALAEVAEAVEAQEAVAGTVSRALLEPQFNRLDQFSFLIIRHL